jgi:hypothetical protein
LSSRTTFFAASLFFTLLAACSDSSDTGGSGGSTSTTATTTASTGGGGDATSTTSDTSTTSTGSGPECDEGPGYAGDAHPLAVDSVDADVVDLEGNAVVDLPIQVCGLDKCLYGNTDSSGHVHIQSGETLNTPSFKFGDGLEYPRFAVRLPDGDSTYDLGETTTAKLPAVGEGAEMAPGGSETSGDVTLTFADDATIEYDDISFDDPAYYPLRTVTIPPDQAPFAVDPAQGFEMIFGASPFETLFCPPAGVTVPNQPAWPAGTEVELWINGVSLFQDFAPYGGWAKVAEGRVSDDGATVSTNDGEGLPLLSSFAIRKK